MDAITEDCRTEEALKFVLFNPVCAGLDLGFPTLLIAAFYKVPIKVILFYDFLYLANSHRISEQILQNWAFTFKPCSK